MRLWAWRGYLAVGVLAVGGYYLLPAPAKAVLNAAVGASAVAAIAVGQRWHRPARPAAWRLLAAGEALFVVGDVLFSVFDLVLHIEPFPSAADAFYLAGYPPLAAGLVLLIRGRSRRRDWAAVLDAAIIAVGFGLLSWVLIMVPYVRDPSLSLLERVFSLAYPACDLLLLALAARFMVTPGRRTVAYPLLAGNLIVVLAADLVFSALALAEQYTGTSLADAGYMLAYLLIGAAALHPSMVGLSEPAPAQRARLGRVRLLALGAAALVAPALLAVQRLQGGTVDVWAIAGGWAVLFVLVVLRIVGLVRDIERAETERRRLLDRTVQAGEEERAHVAALLHDGPIQRLTALSFELERARRRVLEASVADGVARLEQAQAALSVEVQGLRELMVSLRPPVLDEVGLEAALRDHVEAFARDSGVACDLRVALDGRLGAELETVVYRVAQEALRNVARHAEARQLWLALEVGTNRVELVVRDDGVGFVPVPSSVLLHQGHLGLVAMRERVEMAGGSWQVSSRPGAGVTIRASFDLPRAA
jgi:signal transduction histidine kinase